MAEIEVLLTAKDLIARHEEWKLTFWAAVYSRKALTVQQIDQIVHGERCPIGRWLEAQADEELGGSAEYETALNEHGEFHGEMMQVAAMLARKDFVAAASSIKEGSSFALAGRRLAVAILALNRVCRILAEP